MRELNLATQPFVNQRPVKRTGMLLTVAAVALSAWTGFVYWQHFSGEGRTRSRSQELGERIATEEAKIGELQQQLSALDLGALNRRARFVNLEIDRRRFSWSRLFDHTAQVLPPQIRLLSLTPRFEEQRRGGVRRRAAPDEVALELRGVAKSDAAVLAFIDKLFEHPSFSNPDLSRESRREDRTLVFSMSVLYHPRAEVPAAADARPEEAGARPEPTDELDAGGQG